MGRWWRLISSLDHERSIWVEEEELGKDKLITHKRKSYRVKIPSSINRKVTLRLRGLGRKRGKRRGDLLLHVWLNRGDDTTRVLWLSETSARSGAQKRLWTGEKKIQMVVPPGSRHGMQIRLRGLGKEPRFTGRVPAIQLKRGDLLVKLVVFPDSVTPNYGAFARLSTDDMVLEGWVYRKIDEVVDKLGESILAVDPIDGDAIADVYNVGERHGIFGLLRRHLKLTHLHIQLETSDSMSQPGSCQRTVVRQDSGSYQTRYLITINEQFLDNPFAVAAILAHELCHVTYSERFEDPHPNVGSGFVFEPAEASLERERMVDLLVFMFKIGEFQLRVSRDTRLTLGYFNQSVFDRMQVIVSRKLDGP